MQHEVFASVDSVGHYTHWVLSECVGTWLTLFWLEKTVSWWRLSSWTRRCHWNEVIPEACFMSRLEQNDSFECITSPIFDGIGCSTDSYAELAAYANWSRHLRIHTLKTDHSSSGLQRLNLSSVHIYAVLITWWLLLWTQWYFSVGCCQHSNELWCGLLFHDHGSLFLARNMSFPVYFYMHWIVYMRARTFGLWIWYDDPCQFECLVDDRWETLSLFAVIGFVWLGMCLLCALYWREIWFIEYVFTCESFFSEFVVYIIVVCFSFLVWINREDFHNSFCFYALCFRLLCSSQFAISIRWSGIFMWNSSRGVCVFFLPCVKMYSFSMMCGVIY